MVPLDSQKLDHFGMDTSRPPCKPAKFHWGLWIGALGALHHKGPEDAMARASTSLESWGAHQNDRRLYRNQIAKKSTG